MHYYQRKLVFVFMVVMVFITGFAFAQDNVTFSGKVYFDYSHDVSKDGPRSVGPNNGFMFRRVYFTANKNIDDNFSVRFRTDADRGADSKLRPFIKHVYLKWKDILPASDLYVGMAATPAWRVSEEVWGYRGLTKIIWDNFKDVTGVSNSASSADVGLGLDGAFMEKQITYRAMLSNGTSYSKGEDDSYKKFALSVSGNFSDFILEGYADYEPKNSKDNFITWKGFAAYSVEGLAVGVEYYIMIQGGMGMNGTDLGLSGFSVFGRYNVIENGTAILRYDMYDPDTDIDNNETDLVIAAFDYRPSKTVSVIPNINYYTNGKALANHKSDIIAKLTFVWSYK